MCSIAKKPSGNSQINPCAVEVHDYEVPMASYDLPENVVESVPSPQNQKNRQHSILISPVYSGMEDSTIRDSTAGSRATYSQLNHGSINSSQQKNELAQEHMTGITKSMCNEKVYICFLGFFVVCLVAVVVALVAAFVWLGKLNSELNAAVEAERLLFDQKEVNASLVNKEVITHPELQQKFSNELDDLKASIKGVIESLQVIGDSQINNMTQAIQQIQSAQNSISNKVQNVSDSCRALTRDFSKCVYSYAARIEDSLLNNISNVQFTVLLVYTRYRLPVALPFRPIAT